MILRLVAQYADYCNVFGDVAQVAHKYDVLRKHCQTVGRPFDAITRTNMINLLIARNEAELGAKKQRYPEFSGVIGTPEMVVAQLTEFGKVGSQEVLFHMPDADTIEPLLLLGESVIPQVAPL